MSAHAFGRPALSADLPASTDAPALARRALDGWLPRTVSDDDRGALRLLVTELVTNSVRHSGAGAQLVGLTARVDADRVRIEVSDRGEGFEVGTPTPRGADGGYGLYLVERMASSWGVERDDGTQVWFELPLSPPAAA